MKDEINPDGWRDSLMEVLRSSQEDLVATGFSPEPDGSFVRRDVRCGFLYTMGGARVWAERSGKRWVVDLSTADPTRAARVSGELIRDTFDTDSATPFVRSL